MPWLAWALLALVVAGIYVPGLRGGFVFDDYPNLVDNVALRVGFGDDLHRWIAAAFSSPSSELQRPLAMLSFALNHAITGLDPFWMKATNLGIHLLNALLAWTLARQLLVLAGIDVRQREVAAWCIAAFWALACINFLGVLFVVQRMESLCHTFVFAGLCLYVLGRRRMIEGRRGGWLVLIGIAGGTVAGILVKESAALLPLYAVLIEGVLLHFADANDQRGDRLLWFYGLILVLPLIAGASWLAPGVWSGRTYAGHEFTLVERLLTEGRVLVDYLHWTLFPNPGVLSLYHDDYPLSQGLLSPPSTLASFALLAGLVVAAVAVRRRRPLLALGIAWFLAAHALTATVIPLELVYEHRNYFASFGVALALGDLLLLVRSERTRRLGLAVLIVMLAWQGLSTALRAREWSNPLRLVTSEAAKHPHSPRATYDLARYLVIATGFRADAPQVPMAFAALEHAMRVPGASGLPEAAAILLASRIHAPIPQAWWSSLQRKLGAHGTGPQQNSTMAALTECQIRGECHLPPQAMVDCFAAARRGGGGAEMRSIYGNFLLNVMHDHARALQLWTEAAQMAPGVAEYQISLAKFHIAAGRPDLARVYIDRLRRMGHLGQNEARARELERLANARPQQERK